MPNYLLTFHGDIAPMPDDPAQAEAQMQQWGAWYGSMGEAVVDGGAPFSHSAAIGPDGSDTAAPASITGYTVVKADDIEGAKALAQGCPVLQYGHSVQISETIDMS